MNVNKVILAGNLTRDVELRHAGSTQIASFGLAVNRKWKSAEGEQKEEVTFIDCDAFGKTAEVIAQYMAKGKPIFIEGRLKLDQWEDKEGQKRSKLKVIVDTFQFVGGKGDGESRGGANENRPAGANRSEPRPRSYGGGGPVDDQIPFAPEPMP